MRLINGRYTVKLGTLGTVKDYDYFDSHGAANRRAEQWRAEHPELEVSVYYGLTLLDRWRGNVREYSK